MPFGGEKKKKGFNNELTLHLLSKKKKKKHKHSSEENTVEVSILNVPLQL